MGTMTSTVKAVEELVLNNSNAVPDGGPSFNLQREYSDPIVSKIKVMVSIYHLALKFHTPKGAAVAKLTTKM